MVFTATEQLWQYRIHFFNVHCPHYFIPHAHRALSSSWLNEHPEPLRLEHERDHRIRSRFGTHHPIYNLPCHAPLGTGEECVIRIIYKGNRSSNTSSHLSSWSAPGTRWNLCLQAVAKTVGRNCASSTSTFFLELKSRVPVEQSVRRSDSRIKRKRRDQIWSKFKLHFTLAHSQRNNRSFEHCYRKSNNQLKFWCHMTASELWCDPLVLFFEGCR